MASNGTAASPATRGQSESAWTKLILQNVARLMELILRDITGLDDLARKTIIYYTLATYTVRKASTFPMLVFRGPMGTGKSEALKMVAACACRPNAFGLRSMSLPVFRDELAKAHDGTAVIEEADSAWGEGTAFERMFSDRYQRSTARAALKVPTGDGGYYTEDRRFFGATVVHRRLPFADQALEGRSIVIRFRPKPGDYPLFKEDDSRAAEVKKLLRGRTFKPPAVAPISGVAGRIFDSYMPIIGVAQLCGDKDFVETLADQLRDRSLELTHAQHSEPEVLVLRALIENLFPNGNYNARRVPLSEITATIRRTHQKEMQPEQVGAIARQLGFETKISHGVTKVLPDARTLVKVADEYAYKEEAITTLKQNLRDTGRGGRLPPVRTKRGLSLRPSDAVRPGNGGQTHRKKRDKYL